MRNKIIRHLTLSSLFFAAMALMTNSLALAQKPNPGENTGSGMSSRSWLKEVWKDKVSASLTSSKRTKIPDSQTNEKALTENADRLRAIINDDANWDENGEPKDKEAFKHFIDEELRMLRLAYQNEGDENTKKKIQKAIDDAIEAGAGLYLK